MKHSVFTTLALALLGTLVAAGPLRAAADETIRRAQQALRDGGFYYGPIDGTSGEETTQATRRYQIRNGLAVSGQLNAETLRSLNINAPPPPVAAGPRPPRPDPTPSRSEPTPPPLTTPAPTPTPRPVPPVRSAPPAPRVTPPPYNNPPATSVPPSRPDLRAAPLPPGAQVPSAPLTGFFSRTPYEFAPPAVQSDVLRRAQRVLHQGGFYDGPADGLPTRRTVEALGEFQGAFRLDRTRRLDAATLRFLRLLPGAGSSFPEAIPSRRRTPAPDFNNEEEEEEDDAPPVRVRPRRGNDEVYQGRIIS